MIKRKRRYKTLKRARTIGKDEYLDVDIVTGARGTTFKKIADTIAKHTGENKCVCKKHDIIVFHRGDSTAFISKFDAKDALLAAYEKLIRKDERS